MQADKRQLAALLSTRKDSSSIHYDEDTIPHGACSDPVACDCCCPCCWEAKAVIIRRGVRAAGRVISDAIKSKSRRHLEKAVRHGL